MLAQGRAQRRAQARLESRSESLDLFVINIDMNGHEKFVSDPPTKLIKAFTDTLLSSLPTVDTDL